MTGLQRAFIQYCRVYVWVVFLEFFLAGLGSFHATDDYHLHNLFGLGLLAGSGLMLLWTIAGRFPGFLIRMTAQLVAINALMLWTGIVNEDAPADADLERGLAAFHVVIAVGIYVLASVIVRRAAAAFGVKPPLTLFNLVSRLKRAGRSPASSETGSSND
ncbi:MAG: DUF6220 domain-containing protein [Gaiellaceae bacterium]